MSLSNNYALGLCGEITNTPIKQQFFPGNTYWGERLSTERLSTVDLLFKVACFLYKNELIKTSYCKEVNLAEPSTSVRLPWFFFWRKKRNFACFNGKGLFITSMKGFLPVNPIIYQSFSILENQLKHKCIITFLEEQGHSCVFKYFSPNLSEALLSEIHNNMVEVLLFLSRNEFCLSATSTLI